MRHTLALDGAVDRTLFPICNVPATTPQDNASIFLPHKASAHYFFLRFAHRACPAFRAISLRSSGVSFAALAFAPLWPSLDRYFRTSSDRGDLDSAMFVD